MPPLSDYFKPIKPRKKGTSNKNQNAQLEAIGYGVPSISDEAKAELKKKRKKPPTGTQSGQ